MAYTSGFGDEQTWPACDGHPHDPRTEEVEGDGFENLTGDELVEFARAADAERAMLLAALKAAVIPYLKGDCYETKNPYSRPYVKQALIAVAKVEGKSAFGNDWMDAIVL